ncbi:MAG: transcription-repair coupling factor [bacterium]|nr:transcription-repair coupling factor [bacterium]
MIKKIVIDKNKNVPGYNDLIKDLVDTGYVRVNMVLEPGEFALRGAIIDIYPYNQSHPLRIEYFDNEIDRLNSFNVHNQRSISSITATEILVKDQWHDNFYAVSSVNEDIVSDIKAGDYIVHDDYGIGYYQGLVRMVLRGYEGEYVYIKYKGEDKIYVPLDKLHKVHKYSAGEFEPKVNALYDGVWQRVKSRAKKAAQELAADIYLLYKIRSAQKGFAFGEDSLWQIDLEKDFKHEVTSDQEKAIREVKRDMESHRPMDRIICGDVGYGKTEVLIRAAFKAVQSGKQVAVLVPTTILAEQHFRRFDKRFKDFPYRVDVLSRFRDKKEQKIIINDLKKGKVNLVIGTHRLLQKDIEFYDLGLLIIDEEQRFGVFHKEKIKKIKSNVDVLSVSATPIPRTLYMALTGAKAFSNIETPPKLKKPVLTAVSVFQDSIIERAIFSEIKRGGQVFYIHNKVKTIDVRFEYLKRLLPGIKFAVAHGQMKENELQNIMFEFFNNKIDVLICTTIIESGLDVANANTIIIEEAENFGLSQIHQLRGRVGRTDKQGYAYLMHEDGKILSDKARKRLKAIKEYAVLGAGYKIALRDLEIRGAGTMLGHKQHGHIVSVGFELYCKLLEESVNKVKSPITRNKPAFFINPEISVYISEDYISAADERLAMYKRIMNLNSVDKLNDLISEMIDRYGSVPDSVRNFFDYVREQLC